MILGTDVKRGVSEASSEALLSRAQITALLIAVEFVDWNRLLISDSIDFKADFDAAVVRLRDALSRR